MSIFNARYERYKGPLLSTRTRFLVITGTEIRRLWKEKWVRRFFILASMPVIGFAIQLFVAARTGTSVDADRMYTNLFTFEAFFVALMMAAFGASMIARDVNNRALTLYFTRPLDVDQYLWGKLTAAAAAILGVTLAPGLFLALARMSLSPGADLATFAWDAVRLAGVSAVNALLVGTLILLLSSLIRSPRYVGFTWLGLFLFLEIARGVLTGVLGPDPLLDLMSIWQIFVKTADYVFIDNSEHVTALVASLVYSAFFYLALRLRIAALERAQT